ncbi:hypothetical protein [Nocardia sp. NPDC024068]|uniref:hypothetical protein n=1 Tax=Nocardia sp. NPDC024068 TaxID=3157197 RepID=UPI00340FD860
MADESIAPESAGDVPVSTPLHRAAGQLQSALPAGWQVRVVDAEDAPQFSVPILRALLATD